MSHPTLRILAFSPPVVNGQDCSLLLNFSNSPQLTLQGSAAHLRALADSILEATGGSTAKIPAPLKRSKHHAKFMVIAQELARGDYNGVARLACERHGVPYSNFIYWRNQQREARA